jgi:hypothetical protein
MTNVESEAATTVPLVALGKRWLSVTANGQLAQAIDVDSALGRTFRVHPNRTHPRPWDALCDPPKGQKITGLLVYGEVMQEPQHFAVSAARVTIELVVRDARVMAYQLVDELLDAALVDARTTRTADADGYRGIVEALDELDRAWPLIRELGPYVEDANHESWHTWREDYLESTSICRMAVYPIATPRWLSRLADALEQRADAMNAERQRTRNRMWAFESAIASMIDDEPARERVLDIYCLTWLTAFRSSVPETDGGTLRHQETTS